MAAARWDHMVTSGVCRLGPSLSGCSSQLNTSSYHVLSTRHPPHGQLLTQSSSPPEPCEAAVTSFMGRRGTQG